MLTYRLESKRLRILQALTRAKQCVLSRQDASSGTLSRQGNQAVSGQRSAQLFSPVDVRFQLSLILLMANRGESLTANMHRALASGDPDLPFSDPHRIQAILSRALAIEGAALAIVCAIAILGLALCAVGVFVLVGNVVAPRLHAISHMLRNRNAHPAGLCLSADMTGSVGKLEKLFISREAAFLKQTDIKVNITPWNR